jgi:TonB family protein
MKYLLISLSIVVFVQCKFDNSEEAYQDVDFSDDEIEWSEELIDTDTDTTYDVTAKSPEFFGGAGEMAIFIQENFKYPEEALINGEQGTIWVEFVVWNDGKVKKVKVVKGVSRSLDREAKRVVRHMPNWTPGEQAGKAVNVRYTIPIKAKLD